MNSPWLPPWVCGPADEEAMASWEVPLVESSGDVRLAGMPIPRVPWMQLEEKVRARLWFLSGWLGKDVRPALAVEIEYMGAMMLFRSLPYSAYLQDDHYLRSGHPDPAGWTLAPYNLHYAQTDEGEALLAFPTRNRFHTDWPAIDAQYQRLADWDETKGSLTSNPKGWRDQNAYGWFMHGHPGFTFDGPVELEPWKVGDGAIPPPPPPPAG